MILIIILKGPLGGGSMTLTSSIGVYGDSNGNTVNELFRLDTRSKRSTTMISAEEAVVQRDGKVIVSLCYFINFCLEKSITMILLIKIIIIITFINKEIGGSLYRE